jgi:hypothetical protein
LAKNEKERDLVKSGEKKKHLSFYTKYNEINNAFYCNQSMIEIMYKNAYLNTNELDPCILSVTIFLL